MLKLSSDEKKAFNKSKFNKIETTIIASRLDQAFREFNDKFEFIYEPKKKDFGWHPSGDCLPSVTDLYAQADGILHPERAVIQKDMSGLNKTFMVGHYWHQIIQHLLVINNLAPADTIERVATRSWHDGVHNKRQGDKIDDLNPFCYVRGQGDVAPLITSTWEGLIDIKTMGSSDFNLKRVPDRYSKKYLAQINIYMDLFDLDQAMILAVNKDSGHGFQEFTFVRDQQLIDEIYRKWEFVSECLEHGIIPTEADNKAFKLYIEDK